MVIGVQSFFGEGGRGEGGGLLCPAKFTKANVVHLFPVSNHESVLFFSSDYIRRFLIGPISMFQMLI